MHEYHVPILFHTPIVGASLHRFPGPSVEHIYPGVPLGDQLSGLGNSKVRVSNLRMTNAVLFQASTKTGSGRYPSTHSLSKEAISSGTRV